MPRLVGKQPNSSLYAVFSLIFVVALAAGLEYFGVIDLVDNFGSTTNLLGSNVSERNVQFLT
jgi:hypothetical protein